MYIFYLQLTDSFPGVGFPKTGTSSLKNALEILGYRVYHREDMYSTVRHSNIWVDYLEKRDSGATPPFEKLLAGYDAVLEFGEFHKELHEMYPNAKLVLTERDAEKWINSIMSHLANMKTLEEHFWIIKMLGSYTQSQKVKNMIFIGNDRWKRALAIAGSNDLRKGLLQLFFSRNALLKSDPNVIVMDSKDGWKNLCAGLKVDVPNCAYPFRNAANATLHQTVVKGFVKNVLIVLILPLFGIILAYKAFM